MDRNDFIRLLAEPAWHRESQGPRHRQLHRRIAAAIEDGSLAAGAQLPPERDLAVLAGVSRVTVRKALAPLVAEGLIVQVQGAGSFVRDARPGHRLETSLSALSSFTEYMRRRGMEPSSVVLSAGLVVPGPAEMVALGLPADARAARIRRLRSADGVPMAIETSTLPADILPRPDTVSTSLYDVLRQDGHMPVRAIQRINAINLDSRDCELLGLPEGRAVLLIERTGYLSSGRPVEFTRGIYRGDIYDFVAELRL